MGVELLRVFVPGTVMPPNELWRKHHMVRHEHVALERRRTAEAVRVAGLLRGLSADALASLPPVRVQFLLWRRRRLDDDSLPFALKAHRDGVKDSLDTDDGPESGNVWEYAQERTGWGRSSAGAMPGVAITITELEGAMKAKKGKKGKKKNPHAVALGKHAAKLGRLGGKVKGGKKAEAVRKNGLKGGRPRLDGAPARRKGRVPIAESLIRSPGNVPLSAEEAAAVAQAVAAAGVSVEQATA